MPATKKRLFRANRSQRSVTQVVVNTPGYRVHGPLQELTGAVAPAVNVAVALGRNVATLTYAAYVAGANWANSSGQIARHTAGSTATIQQDGIIAPGKTWEYPVVISNRTAGSVSITGGDVPANANGTTLVTITAIGADVIITPTSDFDGDIDLAQGTVKQTDILASSAYPGPQLLSEAGDGVMDKDNWISGGFAILTNPEVGVLRVTRSTSPNPTANQDILTLGIRYQSTPFQARSDGNAIPKLFFGGGTLAWTGTTSTDWQNVNVEGVATGPIGNKVFLQSQTAVGVEYTEWRNGSTRTANPLNGDHVGVLLGQPGNSQTVMVEYDGATAYTEFNSGGEFNSILDPTSFSEGIFVQKDTWDAAERDFISYTVDANNYIRIGNTTTPGQLRLEHMAGGTLEQVLYTLGTITDMFFVMITVESGVMKAWVNGAQVGSNQAVAGTFVGNFATMVIGARNDTPTNGHLGRAAYSQHFDGEISEAENLAIAIIGGAA